MGLFDKSSSKKTTNNTYQDQRVVNDASSGGVIAGGNVQIVDPGAISGAVKLGQYNAQLLGAVAETQTDAIKAIANFGLATIKSAGGSATNLLELGAQNTAAGIAGINAAAAASPASPQFEKYLPLAAAGVFLFFVMKA